MVAQLLHRSGLYLGPEEELIGPGPDNPDGYWEHSGFHRLNESMLAELGGGWDNPPAVPARWREDPRLEAHASEAERLIDAFAGHPSWGWKDPRTSLTLALWSELIPDLKVIVCVRNPLEVAFSLNRRGMFSYSNALKLWQTYNERIIAGSRADQRLITEYEAFFTRPEAELERILAHAGIAVSAAGLRSTTAVCRAELRHIRFDDGDLATARVSPEIADLYQSMRAGGRQHPVAARQAIRKTSRIVDEDALELRATAQQLQRLTSDFQDLQEALKARDHDLAEGQARERALIREIEILRERAASQHETLLSLHDLQGSFFALETEVLARLKAGGDRYGEEIHSVKQMVLRETPLGARMAVVTKGDERLLGFYGRTGVHFPQQDDGMATGHHPSSGLSAIAHLAVVRTRGAEYFLIPPSYLWWLEHYPDLRRHLNRGFRRVASDNESGVLFSLRGPVDKPTERRKLTADLVAATASLLGCAPAVLDWNTGLDLANALPRTEFCAHASPRGKLPHADESVDIVAVTTNDPAVIDEANRVASAVRIAFPAPPDDEAAAGIHLKMAEAGLPVTDVSIVASVTDECTDASWFLESLEETLPTGYAGELILVDARSSDSGVHELEHWVSRHERAQITPRRTQLGRAAALNQGASWSSEDSLVFLSAATLLLPDWLHPLLDLLRRPEAGAAGGLVLASDGSPLRAGGLVLGDGSPLHLGHGHQNPAAPDVSYVRTVDFCSSAIMATRRAGFLDVGGFRSDLSADDADVEYCRRLRKRGMDVFVQPMSAVVTLAG